MDKDSYLSEIAYTLGNRLSHEDKDEILSYYKDYFAHGILRGHSENDLCEKLGDPEHLARELIAEHSESSNEAAQFAHRLIAWFSLGTCLAVLAMPFVFLSGKYTRLCILQPLFMLICTFACMYLTNISMMVKYACLRSRKPSASPIIVKVALCIMAFALAIILCVFTSLCLSTHSAPTLPAPSGIYAIILRLVYCACATLLVVIVYHVKKLGLNISSLYFILIGFMCTCDSLVLILTRAQNTADIRIILVAAALPTMLGLALVPIWYAHLQRRVQTAKRLLYSEELASEE